MKKEQIIETARELFHQFGFKKVSMDEIAQTAGVTKKTIYTYFGSKEELLKYFIQEEIENMKDIVEEGENKQLEFFEGINQTIYRLLKYKKERNFLNIISKEAELLKNPIIIQNLKLIDEQIQNYIGNKLKSAQEKGYIQYDDLEITTYLIYKMYIALILEWDDKSQELDEQMIANSISKILINGLKK
jgi:AcrR family transcriptional regulator